MGPLGWNQLDGLFHCRVKGVGLIGCKVCIHMGHGSLNNNGLFVCCLNIVWCLDMDRLLDESFGFGDLIVSSLDMKWLWWLDCE